MNRRALLAGSVVLVAGLRRGMVAAVAGAAWAARAASLAVDGPAVQRGRRLTFPRDHGAHPRARTEWWYLTGWLGADAARPHEPTHGFQVTFFRSRRAPAMPAGPASLPDQAPPSASAANPPSPGRFDARQLLFAHAAITDLAAGRHHHAQRFARWNGSAGTGPDRAAHDDADIVLARWRLRRRGPTDAALWSTEVRGVGFALTGSFATAQPLLLQGDAGYSRKGPEEQQASHYYSLPQLAARLTVELNGRRFTAEGRAWLDHEWSDDLMHPLAVGWDWIGFNLFDGGALTAFRLRRADGQALWAGGSWRDGVAAASGAAHVVRSFDAGEVRFEPGRRWRSPSTNADYPVVWQVHTPAGRHSVRALLDTQELDSRGSTGAVYWEGLAELLDEAGHRIGLGYLEMTGYSAPLKLGG